MRGATTAQQTTRNSNTGGAGNSHYVMGTLATSPLILLALIVVFGIAVTVFTLVQVTNTEQSVFALLQVAQQLQPGQTGAQVGNLINGNIDYYNGIAGVCGWGVQIALWMTAFPPEMVLASLHRRFNFDASPALVRAAVNYEKTRRFIQHFLITCNVLTDFLNIVRGHDLFPGFVGIRPVIPFSTWGVLLIGIFYPAVICYVTIFGLKFLLFFIEALIDKVTQMHQVENGGI